MKCSTLILATMLFASCGGGQKLFERATPDNGRVVVKKEFFSGIDYIHFEKKIKKRLLYSMIYDCECGITGKISLHKATIADKGTRTSWTAVTDTTDKPIFFGEIIAESRLHIPTEFMPITEEEISLLEEALSKVDKACCKNPDKPISKIIGYVRVKLNN